MFERFTEQARRVLFFARYEASQCGSTSIETEHLVLGLLRDGKGTTPRILARHDLTLDEVRTLVEALAGTGTPNPKVEIPFGPSVKRVIQNAELQADRSSSAWIGSEHLFLGVLQDASAPVTQALNGRGMTLDTVRAALEEDDRDTTEEAGPLPAGIPDYVPSDTVHISHAPERDVQEPPRGYPGLLLLGMDLRSLIAAAYGITPDRVMVPDPLLDGRLYDLAIKPRGRRGGERLKALAQQGIEQYFKLILSREERDGVDVIAARQDVGA